MLCTDLALCQERFGATHIEPLRCRSWSCEYCRPKRARQLISEGLRGKPNTFITLTVNPSEYGSPDERAQALSRAWVAVRKSLARVYGIKKLPFLAVFEKTKKGEPHLHILARVKWIDQKWLSEKMKSLINAPIVDIQRIKNAKARAAYVAKYVGKDPHRFKNSKRYWKSQNYLITPKVCDDSDENASSPWYVMRATVSQLITRARSEGWQIVETARGYLIQHGSQGPPGSREWAWTYAR